MKGSPFGLALGAFALLFLPPSDGNAQSTTGRVPKLVSPGQAGAASVVASNCPTFSWDPVVGATSHQLALFRVVESAPGSPAVEPEKLEQVLVRSLPGGTSSWTPDLAQCLASGVRYAWAVRALRGDAGSEPEGVWSEPRTFETPPPVTDQELARALALVRRHLAERGLDGGQNGESVGGDGVQGVEDHPDRPLPPPDGLDRVAHATTAPTRLNVAGNVNASSFTGDGATLSGVATASDLATHAGDSSAHHAPTVDTTCDGAVCNGTKFTNVTAIAGDGATAFFRSGQIEVERIADGIARDSEIPSLELGDIQGVTAGVGLLGGGTTGTPILDADIDYLQRRVSSACPDGSAIREIAADGSVTCEADTVEGSFTLVVNALTCTPQGDFGSGDVGACSNSGVTRTDGSDEFPCVVRGTTQIQTYVCDLVLPDGAEIDQILAFGYDNSMAGYYEAAVWRSSVNNVAPSVISSFGGAWQDSGLVATTFYGSFEVYPGSDPPHTVSDAYRYMLGFRVDYTIP